MDCENISTNFILRTQAFIHSWEVQCIVTGLRNDGDMFFNVAKLSKNSKNLEFRAPFKL